MSSDGYHEEDLMEEDFIGEFYGTPDSLFEVIMFGCLCPVCHGHISDREREKEADGEDEEV